MKNFKLPDLGEGLQEVEIISWHVSEGDNVVVDQPLVSVETEKAVVEIPSPRSGRIAKITGIKGDIVKIGSTLVEFEEGPLLDAGAIVGSLPEETSELSSRQDNQKPTPQVVVSSPQKSVKAPPAVRALAQKLGVKLEEVTPTGPKGTVTRPDIEQAAQGGSGGLQFEPLRGVRRSMAQHMAKSHAEVVPATLTEDADIDGWIDTGDITVRLIRAIIAGVEHEPALNAWFKNDSICVHKSVSLGIAVDTGEGLFVPVLQGVNSLSEQELRNQINQLKEDVQSRNIRLETMQKATLTLSNFGTLAGRYGAMVVVPPQVAIIGAGKIRPQVIAVDDKPTVRKVLPLSLTFDHRAVTGGEAARFMAAVKKDLEKKI